MAGNGKADRTRSRTRLGFRRRQIFDFSVTRRRRIDHGIVNGLSFLCRGRFGRTGAGFIVLTRCDSGTVYQFTVLVDVSLGKPLCHVDNGRTALGNGSLHRIAADPLSALVSDLVRLASVTGNGDLVQQGHSAAFGDCDFAIGVRIGNSANFEIAGNFVRRFHQLLRKAGDLSGVAVVILLPGGCVGDNTIVIGIISTYKGVDLRHPAHEGIAITDGLDYTINGLGFAFFFLEFGSFIPLLQTFMNLVGENKLTLHTICIGNGVGFFGVFSDCNGAVHSSGEIACQTFPGLNCKST